MSVLLAPRGRINRVTYFLAWLASVVVVVVLGALDSVLGTPGGLSGYGLLADLGALALMWPNIVLGVRRFHDMGWSGWTMIAMIIPLVNLIFFFMLLLNGGELGPNDHGEQPEPGFSLRPASSAVSVLQQSQVRL